ncbi:MAG: dihydropteroate synthase [Muribaculaceae bacterium]|nr:dihydropteroate synthase [Muribaculaceae bacterium]MDE6299887.1 dihydropteroate synthase [Muribaculaceae bacterium]
MHSLLTINIRGHLMDFRQPKVMGIVNVTPDSFYSGSRTPGDSEILGRVLQLRNEEADIVDLGGYSTRPGASDVTADEEYSRLARALEILKREWEEVPVSIDTFRADVARRCIEEWGVDIINDISGGTIDPEIWNVVAEKRAVYVLTHTRGTPSDMQTLTDYDDVTADVITDLSKKVYELRGLGVNDIIIDPGFGFAKTREQNFQILNELGEFCKMGMPVLAGLSRKSMIWKTLGVTPEESYEGTVALDAIALDRGADILRVHDVKAARQTVKLLSNLNTLHHD